MLVFVAVSAKAMCFLNLIVVNVESMMFKNIIYRALFSSCGFGPRFSINTGLPELALLPSRVVGKAPRNMGQRALTHHATSDYPGRVGCSVTFAHDDRNATCTSLVCAGSPARPNGLLCYFCCKAC